MKQFHVKHLKEKHKRARKQEIRLALARTWLVIVAVGLILFTAWILHYTYLALSALFPELTLVIAAMVAIFAIGKLTDKAVQVLSDDSRE